MPKQITKVGKYSIVEMIARGGMGAVYKAKHPTLKRFVILKQLTLRGGSGFILRFKREASLMIDFRNEHIVQVYDHFREGSSYYIAMEYVEGKSLDKLIEERGFISNEASVLIFIEICKGLKYAHDKGVIHRDIKPANILISNEGEVKLVDFGIATSKEGDDDGLTKAGMTLGTPAYMSPEQIADTRKVDKRADIYSMGVVFYEMVTGEKPFPGGFTREAIARINKGVYANPRKINPVIPRNFSQLIRKTMNHKVTKRYKDLQQIINLLSRYTKRYNNQNQINTDIKKYLTGKEITFPASIAIGKKKKSLSFKILIGLLAVAVIALGSLYVYTEGYYYEYFKTKEFGSVEIRAAIPDGYYKDPEQVYAFSRLTPVTHGGGESPGTLDYRLVPAGSGFFDRIRGVLMVKDEEALSEHSIVSSRKIYLPAGVYHLELYLENLKLYKTFYLNPRLVQKQNIKTYESRVLQFDLQDTPSKPVQIIPRVYDSVTGESLYTITDISMYIREEDRWIDWKRYIRDMRLQRYLLSKLYSGKRYTFKFDAPSYYPETVRFYVEKDLDLARIEAGLVRIPGTLVIESNYEGLELLIDNRRENYHGDREKQFISYGKTTLEPKELPFSHGSYLLTVTKDKRHVENYRFDITSGEATRLQIHYDKEEKVISIKRIQ